MKLDQEVLAVLSALEYPAVAQVRITEQLDRSMYARVNKVLEAVGGKWNRAKKVHLFGSDARVRIDHVIDTGEVTTAGDVGFFPTPVPLAHQLVEMSGVTPGDHVLEPSAGTGRIVDAILASGAHAYIVERDPEMRRALVGRGSVAIDCDDFMKFTLDTDIPEADYQDSLFDHVVMNPPFCRVGLGDHLEHVRHAHGMIRVGGTLVSVLPSSIKFRRDKRYTEFRRWLTSVDAIVTDLPEGSFRESGTGVNTVTVEIQK